MKSTIKKIVFLSMIWAAPQAFSLEATEYFVRTDGGTLAQCTGTTNAPWEEGSGSDACALKHIFELLDPRNNEVHMAGGSIVNILNSSPDIPSEYAMGRHDSYTSGDCSSSWAYSCTMPSIPGGTADQPTIIRGGLGTSCNNKPVLWGTGRAKQIISIDNTAYVELSCLTVTDKSSCIGASQYPNKDIICDRAAPYDKPFADSGVFMRDSNNILLTDMNIQGLSKGILAGRIRDVKLERVNLFANFSAGWDGDIRALEEDDSRGTLHSTNTGTIEFKDSAISFNGCGLIYNPGQPDHMTPHECAKQDLGGYGDGVGTANTGGDWIFDNVKVLHNNSDGLDMLYHTLGGIVTVKNSHIEGNAGNQLKISGNANIVNSIIIGTCGWNSRQDKSIGDNGENCRSIGTVLSLNYTHTDTQVNLINNTVYSEGDCLLSGGNRTGVDRIDQKLTVVNNVFYGLNDFLQDFENSCMHYTLEPYPFTQIHNNLMHKVKGFGDPCNTFHLNYKLAIPDGASSDADLCTTTSTPFYDNEDYSVTSNPKLTNINLGHRYSAYDLVTLSAEANKPRPLDRNSTVVNKGYGGFDIAFQIPTTDFFGELRDEIPDIGAIEYHAKPKPPIILEVIQVN
jgi:hypothetical protein